MLNVPPPTRIPLGTLDLGGTKVELFLSREWARYFELLNTQVQESAAALAMSAALTALLGEASESPDVMPGPPGAKGLQGDSGLALFMLQDSREDQDMLLPPAVDFTAPPAIGGRIAATGRFSSLTSTGGFGCNGQTAQGAASVGAAATDLSTVIALCNQLRAALIANGIAA